MLRQALTEHTYKPNRFRVKAMSLVRSCPGECAPLVCLSVPVCACVFSVRDVVYVALSCIVCLCRSCASLELVVGVLLFFFLKVVPLVFTSFFSVLSLSLSRVLLSRVLVSRVLCACRHHGTTQFFAFGLAFCFFFLSCRCLLIKFKSWYMFLLGRYAYELLHLPTFRYIIEISPVPIGIAWQFRKCLFFLSLGDTSLSGKSGKLSICFCHR